MIRPALLSDTIEIAEFYEDIRRDTVPVVHSVEDINNFLTSVLIPRGSSYVYEAEHGVVGWLDVHTGWLDQLYCKRGFTGQGIGSELLAFAKRLSPEGLKLYTFQVNLGARKFYAREAFVQVELGDGKGNEEGAPDVLLSWVPTGSTVGTDSKEFDF